MENPRSHGRKIVVCVANTLWFFFNSYAELARVTGRSYQTLYYWFKHNSNPIISIYHYEEDKEYPPFNDISLIRDIMSKR